MKQNPIMNILVGILVSSAFFPFPSNATDLDAGATKIEIAGSEAKSSPISVFLGIPDSNSEFLAAAKLAQFVVKSPADLERCQRSFAKSGCSDTRSAILLSNLDVLPYPDNFVNTLIVEKAPPPPRAEMLRVLVPGGRVRLPDGKTIVKQRPAGMDEWPQWLHGPDNVSVSKDTLVAPPRHLQWLQLPPWGRMHNDVPVPAPSSCVLTAGGRIFYDVDEGHPDALNLPPRFFLCARDAFNGVILWKRPLPDWYAGEVYKRGNPPVVIQRRMACAGDFLYLTESDKAPVLQLDAASGKVLKTYAGTEDTMEIVPFGGALYIVRWERGNAKFMGRHRPNQPVLPESAKNKEKETDKRLVDACIETLTTTVAKLDPDSGAVIWERKDKDVSPVFPMSMAACKDGIFLKTPTLVVRLDPETGKTIWKNKIGAPLDDYLEIADQQKPNWTRHWLNTRPTPWYMNVQFVGRCMVYRDVVLATTHDKLYAVSRKTGETLWNCPSWEGFFLPPDILPIGDKVYVGSWLGEKGFSPVELATGKAAPEIDIPKGGMVHHRCYRRLATTKYLLTSKSGVEFTEMATGKISQNQWTRGSCLAGFLPGNGLLYVTPHPCACFTRTKMNGMIAYAPASEKDFAGTALASRLRKGPACGAKLPATTPASASDWPGFRHDAMRSGATGAAVGPELNPAWSAKIGGTLTPVSVSGDSLYVADADRHILFCLDADTGKEKWNYVTGGRIDSPPTVSNGRVVFGCRDGWTYCLDAGNGELAWRFHASPAEKVVSVFDQLESPWPVHGALVVSSGTAVNDGKPVVYINAGRNSFLDSGIFFCCVDLETGKLLCENKIAGPHDKNGNPVIEHTWSIMGVKNDVLVGDGEHLYIKDDAFDLKCRPAKGKGRDHLVATGLSILDSYRHHRSLWVLDRDTPYFANGAYAGELLSFRGDDIFSFRAQNGDRNCGMTFKSLYSIGRYRMLGDESPPQNAKGKVKGKKKKNLWDFPRRAKKIWKVATSVICDAMVLTGAGDSTRETLYIAGALNPGTKDGLDSVLDGRSTAVLMAFSGADGHKLAEYKLSAPPVFDGMAATRGRIFVSLKNGTVVCFAEK